MGFTPLEGLVMGTRSGDLDPAILDYIAGKEGMSLHEVEMLLNKQSGLLGISGLTNDMRELLAEATSTTTAAHASPSRSSATASASTSAPTSPRWAAPTPSSSPAASARTPPTIRARVADGLEWMG
jgi:acetate kinase